MIVWSGWGVLSVLIAGAALVLSVLVDLSVLMLLLGIPAAVGAFFAEAPGHPV